MKGGLCFPCRIQGPRPPLLRAHFQPEVNYLTAERLNSKNTAGKGELCVSCTKDNRSREQRAHTQTLAPEDFALPCSSPSPDTGVPPSFLRAGGPHSLGGPRTLLGCLKLDSHWNFLAVLGVQKSKREKMNLTKQKQTPNPLLFQISKFFIRQKRSCARFRT